MVACVQPDAATGVVRASTANRAVTVVIRSVPLPPAVTELLSNNKDLLKRAESLRRRQHAHSAASGGAPPGAGTRRVRSASVDDEARARGCALATAWVCVRVLPCHV